MYEQQPLLADLLVHYQFPPFSVGEAGKLAMQPSRREVGHGELALRALRPMMPDAEDFAFLVRLVADTLGSNGSSSMASDNTELALANTHRHTACMDVNLAACTDIHIWRDHYSEV